MLLCEVYKHPQLLLSIFFDITAQKVGEFNLSRTEILTEIKDAEKAADAKVEKARSESREALSKARRDSVKKIQDEEAKIRSSTESKIAAKSMELKAKREEILKEGRAKADALQKASDARMKEVKDFLYKEFERTLDVTS